MLTVEIKDTPSGEVRMLELNSFEWDHADPNADRLWSEGNYACDCNRAIFFAKAKGEPAPGCPCGYERFLIRVTDKATGAVLYDECEGGRGMPECSKAKAAPERPNPPPRGHKRGQAEW